MSDGERESVLNILKKYPNVTDGEIALQARGMSLKDPVKDSGTALQYVNVFNNLSKPPDGYEGQIARYINNDDIEGLRRYVNSHIETDAKANTPADEFVSSSGFKTQQGSINALT